MSHSEGDDDLDLHSMSEEKVLERVHRLRQIFESPVRADIVTMLLLHESLNVSALAACVDQPTQDVIKQVCYLRSLGVVEGNFFRPQDVAPSATVVLAATFARPTAVMIRALATSAVTMPTVTVGDGDSGIDVATTAGDLGAATICADVMRRHLIITPAVEPARLREVPAKHLAELDEASHRLVMTGLRVLTTINPSVLNTTAHMIELARIDDAAAARRAEGEAHETD
jgi:hypothetical protein